MVYECEKCHATLAPQMRACPRCGDPFDAPVPADAPDPPRADAPRLPGPVHGGATLGIAALGAVCLALVLAVAFLLGKVDGMRAVSTAPGAPTVAGAPASPNLLGGTAPAAQRPTGQPAAQATKARAPMAPAAKAPPPVLPPEAPATAPALAAVPPTGLSVSKLRVKRAGPVLIGRRSWFVDCDIRNGSSRPVESPSVDLGFSDGSVVNLSRYDGFSGPQGDLPPGTEGALPRLTDASLGPGRSVAVHFYGDDTGASNVKKPKKVVVSGSLGMVEVPLRRPPAPNRAAAFEEMIAVLFPAGSRSPKCSAPCSESARRRQKGESHDRHCCQNRCFRRACGCPGTSEHDREIRRAETGQGRHARLPGGEARRPDRPARHESPHLRPGALQRHHREGGAGPAPIPLRPRRRATDAGGGRRDPEGDPPSPALRTRLRTGSKPRSNNDSLKHQRPHDPGGDDMGMARHGLIFCTRGLGWAAAIAAALFVMGFVVPVLARSLWVYWRGTGTR